MLAGTYLVPCFSDEVNKKKYIGEVSYVRSPAPNKRIQNVDPTLLTPASVLPHSCGNENTECCSCLRFRPRTDFIAPDWLKLG